MKYAVKGFTTCNSEGMYCSPLLDVTFVMNMFPVFVKNLLLHYDIFAIPDFELLLLYFEKFYC